MKGRSGRLGSDCRTWTSSRARLTVLQLASRLLLFPAPITDGSLGARRLQWLHRLLLYQATHGSFRLTSRRHSSALCSFQAPLGCRLVQVSNTVHVLTIDFAAASMLLLELEDFFIVFLRFFLRLSILVTGNQTRLEHWLLIDD